MFNGRRQPSRGGTSRMMREYQVRFCERLGVKFPGPTRQKPALPRRSIVVRFALNKQTLTERVQCDAMCHNRTHAVQQFCIISGQPEYHKARGSQLPFWYCENDRNLKCGEIL